MPSSRFSKWQYLLTTQALPAWCCVILGILLIMTPYLVEHNGYRGTVLVAMADMPPPFDKTLILIGQHTVDGAVGVVLNRPLTDEQHNKLSAFMRDSGIPVSYGGPFETGDKIFVLQTLAPSASNGESTFNMSPWDDAVRDTPDLLDKIHESLKKGEQRYRVFTGYAAWGPFQLETEIIVRFAWRNVPMSHDVLFQSDEKGTWEFLNKRNQEKIHFNANRS